MFVCLTKNLAEASVLSLSEGSADRPNFAPFLSFGLFCSCEDCEWHKHPLNFVPLLHERERVCVCVLSLIHISEPTRPP